jgi:hypothetical protein
MKPRASEENPLRKENVTAEEMQRRMSAGGADER